MKRVSFKVAKAIKEYGYKFSYEVNEHFKDYFPTYLEVWLWLWREKKIAIDICCNQFERWETFLPNVPSKQDPEEAIIAAIDAAFESIESNL